MSSEDIRSQRGCGYGFFFLAALSLVLSGIHFYAKMWGFALRLLAGALFFGFIAWWALSVDVPKGNSAGESNPPVADAGKPVPVGPKPSHHLVAAQELPPSGNHQSYRKD